MKNMKKFAALFLALSMAVGMTACGSSKKEETTTKQEDTQKEETKKLEGIYYVRVWLNEGELQVGDDIMYVLIGGDIRPRVIDALQSLVGKIKSECVTETELY